MKGFYLILCVCFAVFITIESKESTKKYTEKLSNEHSNQDACRNASGVTIEYIQSINKTDEELEAPGMEETRNNIGCYLSCMMQEKEIMSGPVVHQQKLIDMLKSLVDSSEEVTQDNINLITTTAQDCVKKVENVTNVCEVGWRIGKCIGHL